MAILQELGNDFSVENIFSFNSRPFAPSYSSKTRSEPDRRRGGDSSNDSSFSPKTENNHHYEDDYLILSQCYGGLKESRRSNGSGEGSIASCPPAVPSARTSASAATSVATAGYTTSAAACSPAALAALARSSPRYTSTLSVGTLRSSSRSTGNFLGMLHFDGVDAIPDRLSPKVCFFQIWLL